MNLFFAPEITPPLHRFDPEESVHIHRVLRLKEGEPIELTDGKGHLCQCRITETSPHACQAEILSVTLTGNPAPDLHIAIAPTKNTNRFEWFLEKATEIGVREITPLYCAYSERQHLKTQRLQKILISAIKQSRQLWLPLLHEPEPAGTFLHKNFQGNRFIAYCGTGTETHLASLVHPEYSTVVMIGPEGDFSRKEVDQAIEAGFKPVSLGSTRLRTETAGIVTCAILASAHRIRGT